MFIDFPHEVSLATNHTWLRNNPDGTTTIGLDGFLSRLVGLVDTISLPRKGETVAPDAAGIGMQSRGRGLQLAIPLTGQVVEANPAVLKDPSLFLRDPYGKGWLMRVRSNADTAGIEEILVSRPVEWLNRQAGLVRDFFAMSSPQVQAVVLQEGGLPVEGVLQQFDSKVWERFSDSFATLHVTDEAGHEEARS